VSHPDGLPDLFLDRSLGRIKVPLLLRAAGLRLTTLAEHYGIPADESVADDNWLRLAGSRDWVVFMKDTRVRYNRPERQAVKAHGVRCFCLANQNLTGDEMAGRFLNNLDAIVRACNEPGPFIYAVHQTRIEKLPIATRS
jgi:PIN like domain